MIPNSQMKRSASKMFIVVSGIIAFVVDVYALVQIIGQIHWPDSVSIPLLQPPRIQFVPDSNLNIRMKDVTLLLLIYVVLAFIAWINKRLRRQNYSMLYASTTHSGDSDESTLLELTGIHSIFLLVFLWLSAFGGIPTNALYFLAEVWGLTTILWTVIVVFALKLLPEGLETRFLGLVVFFIPLWIFLQKTTSSDTWIGATLFVLFVLGGVVLYGTLIVMIYLVIARITSYW